MECLGFEPGAAGWQAQTNHGAIATTFLRILIFSACYSFLSLFVQDRICRQVPFEFESATQEEFISKPGHFVTLQSNLKLVKTKVIILCKTIKVVCAHKKKDENSKCQLNRHFCKNLPANKVFRERFINIGIQ